MQTAEVSKQDLFNACESLFGSDIDVTVEFLRYLKPAGVKAAYRQKAMETHPDRAAFVSGDPEFLEKRFREIHRAYQLLLDFLAHPWKYSLDEKGTLYVRKQPPRSARPSRPSGPVPRPAARPAARPKAARPHTRPPLRPEPFYAGRVPQRRLMLGQYLYYSGQVSLSTLIKAIVWQRLQRPSVGAIAMSWGWLQGSDVLDILRSRKYGEKFGECAQRLGKLSHFQVSKILETQKSIQPLIGKYFLDQNILTSTDLFRHVVNMKMHNKKYWTY